MGLIYADYISFQEHNNGQSREPRHTIGSSEVGLLLAAWQTPPIP